MVQLNSSSQHVSDGTNVISIVLLSVSMMSLVLTVMGIKLKWFRHRLTFEQPENQVANPVLLRTTSVTEIRENCARGVYRQSFDSESLIMRDNPPQITATNGKTKAKSNSDRQSIFRFPFKSKLNLSKFSSNEDETQITTVQQASVHPPSREKDVATLMKNENLKRMIHERLQSKMSVSMPNLTNQENSNSRQFEERSVDETDQIREFKENVDVEKVNGSHRDDTSVVNEQQVQGEIIQKKVKFEEVFEVEEMRIVETKVLAQIENNFDQYSTNVDKSLDIEQATFESSEFTTEIIPPTPMKRKSRGDYFEDVQETEMPVENLTVNEYEPPTVKPRTKRLIHRTSDENFPRLEIGTLDEVIKLSDEKPENAHQEPEVAEISVIPKSILKSSETSSSPKTITFNNLPQTISDSDDDDDSITSSSTYEESEEEDVWSQVDQHRVMLNRHKDIPPPLPKTPPPSAEEELNQFSYA